MSASVPSSTAGPEPAAACCLMMLLYMAASASTPACTTGLESERTCNIHCALTEERRAQLVSARYSSVYDIVNQADWDQKHARRVYSPPALL